MPSGSENRGPGSNKTGAKSAKAIKAVKKKQGGVPASNRAGASRQIPWLTIGAVVAVVALIGALAFSIFPKYRDQQAVAKFTPSESNQDPSSAIDGVVKVDYPAGVHVDSTQRVAYDQSPPFGGPHDSVWANCMNTVYPTPIRTENAVHSLEHGAVWITYNPDTIDDAQRAQLVERVEGSNDGYMLMSPYPGLDKPISLQSWGHQLKLDNADDERINQFIKALRVNRYAYPEVGASCSTVPDSFDPANPPPFDASAPGPDAVPMDGGGITPDASETGGVAGLPSGLPMPTGLEQAPAPAAGGNG